MFSQYALHWALGFLVIYIAAQLIVSKHRYFQPLSRIQKSIAVKLLAMTAFISVYAIVSLII